MGNEHYGHRPPRARTLIKYLRYENAMCAGGTSLYVYTHHEYTNTKHHVYIGTYITYLQFHIIQIIAYTSRRRDAPQTIETCARAYIKLY